MVGKKCEKQKRNQKKVRNLRKIENKNFYLLIIYGKYKYFKKKQ